MKNQQLKYYNYGCTVIASDPPAGGERGDLIQDYFFTTYQFVLIKLIYEKN